MSDQLHYVTGKVWIPLIGANEESRKGGVHAGDIWGEGCPEVVGAVAPLLHGMQRAVQLQQRQRVGCYTPGLWKEEVGGCSREEYCSYTLRGCSTVSGCLGLAMLHRSRLSHLDCFHIFEVPIPKIYDCGDEPPLFEII